MTLDAEIQQTMKVQLIDMSFKRTDCFCLDPNELNSSNDSLPSLVWGDNKLSDYNKW